MSRNKFRNAKSFIPTRNVNRAPSIDQLLNAYFDNEDVQDKQLYEFFQSYFAYLEKAREDRIEDLTEALSSAATHEISDNFTRIVKVKYADPLSVVGSISGAGGRFNIGEGMGRIKPFHCLYVASDYNTAYREVFHYSESYRRAGITPEQWALNQPNDFMSTTVSVDIEKCIDIRDKESIRPFTNVISQIKPTQEFIQWASKMGYINLRTIQTHGELVRSILDPEYLRNYYALDMPANSQWFGYYCLKAGIQGIIYPSLREEKGYNLAVFIDNFRLYHKIGGIPVLS